MSPLYGVDRRIGKRAMEQIYTARRTSFDEAVATVKEAVADVQVEVSQEEDTETSSRPPDLEHVKTAVLNSLTSASGQRTSEHAIREFVAWYCSEPRLAFNRTVVLRYRIHLEQRGYAPATINLRLAAVRRIAYRLGIEPDEA